MRLSANDKARFMEQFQDPSLDIKDLERIWGKPSGTLYRWGFELGVNRPKRQGQIKLALCQVRHFCEEVSRELPPAQVQAAPLRLIEAGRPMELILLLSDLHAGLLTRSFNTEVLVNRLDGLAVLIADAYRRLQSYYSIKRLHIFALGDIVVGELIGRNIVLEELEHLVLTQVYGIAIPQLTRLTERLLGLGLPIKVTAVRGNHGSLGKGAPSKAANWDTVAYLGWQAKMLGIKEDRLSFNIATTEWFNYCSVVGSTWLLVHGDQFPIRGGTPYSAMKLKVDLWHTSMPHPFDYVACGHFHHFSQIRELWINGTLISDDDWSREVLGRVGDCGQRLLGVTGRGIEYSCELRLD